jgi:hypothetical protein
VKATKWVDFNINDAVRVRLTKLGRMELQRQADEFNAAYPNGPLVGLPNEDGDGYSTFALWSLMQDLGALCRIGCPVPFETAIQFRATAEEKGN